MICFPNAKINLGLYVTEKRDDGYHNIETLFLPVPLQDVLEIKPLDFYDAEYELQLAGTPVEGKPDDNLVVRVFLSLKHEFDLPPQTIHLYKRIPTGAGLGGGSSDAAFMMKLLNEQFKLGLSTKDMADRLSDFGADCSFFIRNKSALARGIGDQLSIYPIDLSNYHILIVKPPLSVSTREAYAGIEPSQPKYDLRTALSQPVEAWRECISNDFERHVFRLYPQIAAIKETLYDMHAIYASMSGSGSAVYGLFHHPFEEAAEIFKDCFVFQSRLVVHPATFS